MAHKCPAPSYFSDLISDSTPLPLALPPQATGLPDLLPQNPATPPSGLSPWLVPLHGRVFPQTATVHRPPFSNIPAHVFYMRLSLVTLYITAFLFCPSIPPFSPPTIFSLEPLTPPGILCVYLFIICLPLLDHKSAGVRILFSHC